jgi:hypothetical protein
LNRRELQRRENELEMKKAPRWRFLDVLSIKNSIPQDRTFV